jgi:hypothetical protein
MTRWTATGRIKIGRGRCLLMELDQHQVEVAPTPFELLDVEPRRLAQHHLKVDLRRHDVRAVGGSQRALS